MAKLWIDLTDVVAHARWNARPTGIQRAVLELVASLRADGAEAKAFAAHGSNPNDLEPFLAAVEGDEGATFADRFYARLRVRGPRGIMELAGQSIANLTPVLKQPRVGGEPVTPFSVEAIAPGDAVLFPGAFWEHSGQLALREAADKRGARVFALIHDAISVTDPRLAYKDLRVPFARMFARPLHVIATTKATASALAERSGLPAAASISIVPLAHEFPGFARDHKPARVGEHIASLVGNKPFTLCVGTIEVRKNHERLLSVWADLAARLPDMPRLVVAGRRGWRAEAALARLDAARGADAPYVLVNNPSDADLAWLYSRARFTVYASQMEGWGLPIGESLWFGAPCLASGVSSMPEVGGALCDYFDPNDTADMTRAVAGMVGSPERIEKMRAAIAAAPLRRWADVTRDLRADLALRAGLR